MFDRDITIDPVDRLSRAKPKRKRRAGAFACLLTLLSLGLLSACNDLNPIFHTTLLEQHFNDHKAAFKAIEAELLTDENVTEVAACPPKQEDCFIPFEPPSDQQTHLNDKYRPLLRDLGFSGPVFFTRSKTGFFDFPNMGHAYANGYSI